MRGRQAMLSHRLITDWSGRSTKEFTYALKSGNRRPWASLILCADASRSSSIPTYTEGECITGSVVLNTQEGDPVQAIDITVCIHSKFRAYMRLIDFV